MIIKKKLTPEQHNICWKKGTEPAFTGKYWNSKDKGIYKCLCCEIDLFSSDTKFDSGTGWPSFFSPIKKGLIKEIKPDNTPVSNGDIEVNTILTKAVEKITPGLPIVSEENSSNKFYRSHYSVGH